MSALDLERVSHAFGSLVAVDDFSLSVEQGEIVCLLGPSGCGKTTVLRLAAGLEHLQSGAIRLGGETVAGEGRELPPEARAVGLVFQDYALFPHLSTLDNVTFGLRGQPPRERERRGLEVLELVGMAGSAAAFPHTLSGGQQQRVALARALAPAPKILLLDEPFSGLDSQLRNRVRDQTLHILKASGAASLVVTHDPEEAMFIADRIALMRAGRIEQCGRPESLYRRPDSAFVAGFFGDINRLEGVISDRCVATPLGALPGGELPEGTAVEVLIRPEAIRLRPLEEGAAVGSGCGAGRARVLAARMLGRTSLVHLSVSGCAGAGDEEGAEGGGEGALHLHARVPGAFLPAENADLEIDLDRSQTFVFPRSDSA